MFTLPLHRLLKPFFSLSIAFVAVGLLYSLTLARPLASTIIVNPGDSIQAAINSANPGDTILIHAGAYTESLTLGKAVSLTGVSSATVMIKALSNQRVITITDSSISNTVIISGLTFTGGDVTGGGSTCPGGCGGGLLITGTARPLLSNIAVTNNRASRDGGGLYVYSNSPLTLTQATVVSNAVTDGFNGGGGMYSASAVTLLGGRFERNQTVPVGQGGGLNTGSTLILFGTEFISNAAQHSGGAVNAGTAFLLGGRFVGNQTLNNRGGAASGGAFTISGTQFSGNYADVDGGALYLQDATQIQFASFDNNRTFGAGGAVRAEGALAISNTRFISNTASKAGGAIYLGGIANGQVVNSLFARNRSTGAEGAALALSSRGSFRLLHATIADLNLNAKQAIAVFTGTIGITNTIIANHSVGISQTADSVVYADYNDFYGNTVNLSGTVGGGVYNVFGNPNFVDPANNNYHLVPPSAAIDAGVDAGVYTDLDGNVRPSGSGFDIGAYETIPDVPISGLSAINSSPTAIGSVTTLTATISVGSNVTYTWNFGDGSAAAQSQVVTHIYPLSVTSRFTATVTAANSANTQSASTTVVIVPKRIYLPVILK